MVWRWSGGFVLQRGDWVGELACMSERLGEGYEDGVDLLCGCWLLFLDEQVHAASNVKWLRILLCIKTSA